MVRGIHRNRKLNITDRYKCKILCVLFFVNRAWLHRIEWTIMSWHRLWVSFLVGMSWKPVTPFVNVLKINSFTFNGLKYIIHKWKVLLAWTDWLALRWLYGYIHLHAKTKLLVISVSVKVVDIYLATLRIGKHPPLFTSTSVIDCWIIRSQAK